MRRDTIAFRIGLVTASAVVLTVVVTGVVSVGLVRAAARSGALDALERHADTAVALINDRPSAGPPTRPLEILETQETAAAMLLRSGEMRGDPLAIAAGVSRRDTLAAGQALAYRTMVEGREVLVAARPLASGDGLILARTTEAAANAAGNLLQRQLVALFIGLVVALAGGLLLARRLAAPLRRTATVAQRLKAGNRLIRARPEGPVEVAQVAESLNSLAAALNVSEAQQRDFLLSISHELRTPLTAVRGFAEALADGVVDHEDARGTGRTILAEATRLERLVNDLLDLARARATDFQMDIVPVDLTKVLTDTARVWGTRCADADVPLRTELPDDEAVPVHTDPIRLRQIIDGLMENALRVTPSGAPIVLALRVERDTGVHALIEVRDGGPGLTKDDRAVAFERSELYRRYRGVRPVGTGLGLALVHALAARLGASTYVGTAPEGGARFVIGLPVHPPTGPGTTRARANTDDPA